MTTQRGARFFTAGAALGALVVATAGCHAEKAAEKKPVPVRVAAAEGAGGGAGTRYSANIQPREQVSLAFKSSGYVREVSKLRGPDGRPRNVQQGDTIRRGTVLARVQETDYAEKVNQAKAQVAEASAAYERQRLDFDRAKSLYQSKSMAKADFDAAQASFDSAKAKVDGAQAQLDAAQIALRDCALRAPMDGLVLSRNVEEGTLASAGTVGFTIADTSSVKAVFGVPDMVVRELKLGQPLGITVEAIPGTRFAGRITAIAPSAERESRVFDVEITIPNPDGRLRSGMIAGVETPRGASPAAVSTDPAVPLTAVLKAPSEADKFAVYVVAENGGKTIARIRNVQLGQVVGSRIAVTNGLKVGERVIVSGATIVSDGDEVRLIP